MIDCSYMGHLLNGVITLCRDVASACDLESMGGIDKLQMVSSDNYIPLADADSDNEDDCEHHFHQEGRLEVHRLRRMATREYNHFSVWLIEDQNNPVLYNAFCPFLAAKYAAGQYLFPPVTHFWEGYSLYWLSSSSLNDSVGISLLLL